MKYIRPMRLSIKNRIILLIIGLTAVMSSLSFYNIHAYQLPQHKYNMLFENVAKANAILLRTQQIVDKDFYATISNLNDEYQQAHFFKKTQSLKTDIESLAFGVISEDEDIRLNNITRMIDSFIWECENALNITTTMKEKLSSFERANTIYALLSKNLTEFISLQIKNRQDVASELNRTTKRLRIISIATVGFILSACLIVGLFYAKRISEAIYKELSEHIHAEQQARFLAHHDQLTNLPNRRLFEKCLNEQLNSKTKPKLSLLFIDLDGFKWINDTYGHNSGDEVLKHVGATIQKHIRKEDMVARLGGDEFTVLLVDTEKTITDRISQRIITEIEKPILIEGSEMLITASIGISTCPNASTYFQDLIDCADAAMYAAKRQGKNQIVRFEELTPASTSI